MKSTHQDAPRLPHLHPSPRCSSGWAGREAGHRKEVPKASTGRLSRCKADTASSASVESFALGALTYRGLGMFLAAAQSLAPYPSRSFPWGLCAWPKSSTVGILDPRVL